MTLRTAYILQTPLYKEWRRQQDTRLPSRPYVHVQRDLHRFCISTTCTHCGSTLVVHERDLAHLQDSYGFVCPSCDALGTISTDKVPEKTRAYIIAHQASTNLPKTTR